MKHTTTLAALLLLATAGVASAGGSEGSIGVGAEVMTGSLDLGMLGRRTVGGPSINYDAGKFHVGGFLAIADPGGAGNTDIELGARFYYHVHSTAMADFGIGGQLGMLSFDTGPGPNQDRQTAILIEPGFQIRVFLQANVALSLSAGLTIGAADADGVYLLGQAVGSAGLHYYFF